MVYHNSFDLQMYNYFDLSIKYGVCFKLRFIWEWNGISYKLLVKFYPVTKFIFSILVFCDIFIRIYKYCNLKRHQIVFTVTFVLVFFLLFLT